MKSSSFVSRRRDRQTTASAAAAAARAASIASAAVFEPLEDRRLFTVALASATSVPLSSIPTGNPTAPVLASFDASPGLDVVVAFPATSAITTGYIQFGSGSGTGTFTMSPAVDVGRFTGKPVVGDFDADGKADLAVTDAFAGQVLVYRGNGDGTFASEVAFAAGVSPESLAVADFNGDGLSDLAVGNRSDNTAQVFLGDAAALLGATPTTLATGTDPASLAAADFTGDGVADLLVGAAGPTGSTTGTLQVFAGNGDGTFLDPVNTGGPQGVVATGDLNGDGSVDVVVGVTDADAAVVALNNGDGTFTIPASAVSPGKAAVVADLDANARPDVVTAVAGRVDVLPGLGDGTFGPAVSADAAGGSAAAAGDVNGDGRPDVLSVTATDGAQLGRTLNVNAGLPVGPDLTVDFVSGLPASVLNASSQRVSLKVTNNGNEAVKTDVLLQIVASEDEVFDAQDSILTQTPVKLNLKPGKAKTYKLKFDLSVGVATYTVFAAVDPTGFTGDLNLNDNGVKSPQTLTVADPFVDLTVTNPGPTATTYAVGKSGKVTVTVQNGGNVPASGTVGFLLTLSTDNAASGDDVTLLPTAKKLKIAANGSKTVSLKFKVPAGTPAGSYFVVATVSAGAGITEADADNNVTASPFPVTITA